MEVLFYIAAAVTFLATLRVITHVHPVHALLYLVVALIALALIFYLLGAQFAAALEIIIYGGAIMVLFIFVVMLLGPLAVEQEKSWLTPGTWVGPSVLALVLLGEVGYLIAAGDHLPISGMETRQKGVSIVLYGPYIIGVELASMLLLPGLIGAYHLGRRLSKEPRSC
ncbi:MAG: NADH-quinone oxidoreductase subunit J [Nitrospira sp.]|jgi:NADH-quinone oxidoreductase subunit J|nr:NADH-quinone oxidoreductase subunit J [Nitrospira sp.]